MSKPWDWPEEWRMDLRPLYHSWVNIARHDYERGVPKFAFDVPYDGPFPDYGEVSRADQFQEYLIRFHQGGYQPGDPEYGILASAHPFFRKILAHARQGLPPPNPDSGWIEVGN